MQTDNIVFYQIIRLKDVDLYQTKDGVSTLKGKGYLQALFSKEMNVFAIKFNDIKLHLTKGVQIISSFSGTDGFFTYDFAYFDGFLTFKVPEAHSGPVVTNLDTFFAHTASLIRRSGLHQDIASSNESKFTERLHKTFEAISEVIVHHNKDDGPNQRIVRNFREMLQIEGPNYPMVDIPSLQVVTLMEESGELVRNHQESPSWVELRGQYQPTLVQDDDRLFVQDKDTEKLARWGSNISDVSTNTQRSTGFDIRGNTSDIDRKRSLPSSALTFLQQQQGISAPLFGNETRSDMA